jgi:ATP synthase protein I
MSEDKRPPDGSDRGFADAAWSIPSYLISGMLVYGGIGWLIDRWTGLDPLFLTIGVFVGLGAAFLLIWHRFLK